MFVCLMRPGCCCTPAQHKFRLIQAAQPPTTCRQQASIRSLSHRLQLRAHSSSGSFTLGGRSWVHACASSLATCTAVLALLVPQSIAAELPPAPEVGDCPDCIGEVNGSLNACRLDSSSCVSTANDDADHFIAPWTFDSDRAAAIEQLVRVACGGEYDPGLVQEPFGIRRADAAQWILQTTANAFTGKPLPDKPVRQRVTRLELFDGRLVDRHTASDGSEYLGFVFGEQAAEQAGEEGAGGPGPGAGAGAGAGGPQILDAEFTFLPDDAVVNIRSASRLSPGLAAAKLTLSFEKGLELDQNLARRKMERLRKALHWEVVPVISDFDPKFNNEPLWFERVLRWDLALWPGNSESSSSEVP